MNAPNEIQIRFTNCLKKGNSKRYCEEKMNEREIEADQLGFLETRKLNAAFNLLELCSGRTFKSN